MTLHAFDKSTGKSLKWVAVPLEFVDWMAANYCGAFVAYLRAVDPYDDVRIPDEIVLNAGIEISEVLQGIQSSSLNGVPPQVGLYGDYGRTGAVKTSAEMVEFFDFVGTRDCKVVSVGD